MSDIKISMNALEEPSRTVGKTLIDFYETMKSLEADPEKGGKQAALIVQTINEIEIVFGEFSKS